MNELQSKQVQTILKHVISLNPGETNKPKLIFENTINSYTCNNFLIARLLSWTFFFILDFWHEWVLNFILAEKKKSKSVF